MLLRLSQHISYCLTRASEAERKAGAASNPDTKKHYSEIAQNWSNLARNYQFIESLEQFLLDSEQRRGANPPQPPPLTDAV